MIVFSIMNEFLDGNSDRLNEFMRDDEWSGFFVIEGFGEGTEYIHGS